MRIKHIKKSFSTFLALMLILPTFLTGFVSPAKVAAQVTNPWVTVSNGGNEINQVVEQNDKTYVRLGSGVGNDNVNNPAIFRENGDKGQETGIMDYTFIPETKGETTRFGLMTHYKDSKNFVFVGYDKQGWFWEYKSEGQGKWLQERPDVAIPQPGNEYTIKVEYSGTTLKAALNGKDLFGEIKLDDAAANLVDAPEALKLGQYGEENSQVLLGLEKSSETPVEPGTEEPKPGKPGWEEGPITIEDNQLEEGDFKVIQGNGSLTYNEDGSVTFHAPSGSAKNKIVYNKMPELFQGSFEVDVKADSDLTRFGLIYRVLDGANYNYVGIGDAINQYFMEIFGPKNAWSSMAAGPEFKAGQTYRMKVEFADNNATLYIDDKKISTWTLEGGVSDPGLIGFEKSRGSKATAITFSNLKIEGIVPPPPPEEDTLSSKSMDVLIGTHFPRVIEYRVGDKVLDGQKTAVDQLKINGKLYTPEVKYEKVSKNEAIYKLSINDEHDEGIDAKMIVSLKVVDNNVVFTFDEITNKGEAKISTIDLAGMNFISVNSNQSGAKARLTNISTDVNVSGDTDVIVDASMTGVGTSSSYYVGVLSNDELSATIWTSSEANGNKNLLANRYVTEDGVKALGLGSNTFTYHHEEMSAPTSTPTVKVAIAEDLNGDHVTDWQDGAIAYRDIMQDIFGWQDVNNKVGTRIVMNFGSQVQQPFLKTLDNVKKVALATDGLRQSVLLKGYGNEGHDSAHPDYGDVGERMGGVTDLNALIKQGANYNAEFGVHINAQETYPEAKAFSDKLILGVDKQGWGWLDQGYVIDKMYDLSSGFRGERLDQLKAAAPGLAFIYLDVWYQDQWESNRIADQFFERGWRMTTEFPNVMHNYSTWEHWSTDRNYGGKTLKGKNSELLRFISNHQRDSWVMNNPVWGGTADNPLLGGFELAGFEGWQSDKNFDNFIKMTFDTNIPTKFLQKYYITNWTDVEGDRSKTNLEKEIRLKDPSNDDVVVVSRKDNSRGRVISLNGNVVLDEHTYLLPWVDQDYKKATPKAEKLYHWNLDGGETTWTLPNDFKGLSSVKVYKLTDQGRTDMKEVKVVDNKVTLTAEAKTPYIVVKGESKGIEINEWSTGAHIYDTGFNSATIDDKYTTATGDKEAVSVERTAQTGDARNLSSGDYYLNFNSPSKDTKVSRTITDLEPGKDYVAEVYVDNQSDVKASIKVTGGVKDVSNYTLRSLQKNYVKADSHATNDGYNSKMQRMQVSFTAASDTATLTLSRKAGEGFTKFDDIRIVQKSLKNEVNARVFEQDFETIVQGIYPFVIGNTEGVEDNRIHLSELHKPFTQKGWGGRVVDDVIGGQWSVKVNTGNAGLLYRTVPQHFRFEPGVNYKVSFDYQTTANKAYRFISGDQEIDARNINGAAGLAVNELIPASKNTSRLEFTVTGSENGQTYIGLFSDGTSINMGTGAGTFILDNLRIEKLAPGMSVKNTTIYAEKELDLKSLITFAENSKGKDVTDKVIIDAGDFDPTTPGDYTITFTLKEDGFKDVVHTATVTVELKPSNWYSGKGAPKDSVGKKGDFYLDVTTDELYQKGEEGWKLIGSFNENESKGTTWLVGKGQPDANVGKAGDLYLDTTTGDVYNKEKETKEWKLVANLKGPAGENGQDGSIWLEGKGAPSKDVGKSGDLYLDNATGDVYLKSKEEGWKFVTNLQSSDKEKLSGWVLENGVWYFYDTKTGEKKTGWFNDGGTWYYLNKSGQMQTGWLQEGSKWYYLNSSGAMQTGWATISGKRYYFNSNGVLK